MVESFCCLLSGTGGPLRKSKCRNGKMTRSLKQENLDLDPQNPHEKARHGGARLSSQYRGRDADRRILGAH